MEEITHIREKQLLLKEVLNHLKNVCDTYHLKYWLSNGSLLGAVKYNGFIPWDDDVDIMMPRNDYEKLVHLDKQVFGKFRLFCRESCPTWKYSYAKLSHSDTIVREGPFDFGAEYGLSVDIFPVDAWIPNKCLANLQASFCGLICRFLYNTIATSFQTEKTGATRLVLHFIYRFSKLFGTAFFRKILEFQAGRRRNLQRPPLIGCICWAPYGRREVLNAEWFEPLLSHEFEGERYPIPSGFDEYLTKLYGDYRRDLPKEKQVSNHVIRVWKKQ